MTMTMWFDVDGETKELPNTQVIVGQQFFTSELTEVPCRSIGSFSTGEG